ncbi:PH domain-containing protein [Cryobacterium sp. CG_9.6]|uniref:PH domain-containing protein n=1 Tax=Cryobacterium sp. CG_9.6 TaxID=2760710 RepID=UPI00247723A3|nr:PH domain-containing protein [Cryobacterium sp. CG_9.6]MDH6236141.1 hypothetical protein [Cryobacterium sp. CG_9.6]
MPTKSFEYRPVFGRFLTCAIAAVCLTGLIGLAITGSPVDLLRTVWLLALFTFVTYALFWRPKIVVSDHITVVNVFQTVVVEWPQIERIDTRFSLTLYTKERRISVWAAPSPGVRGSLAIERSDVANLNESAYGPGRSVRPGDSVSTASGQVAFVIRQRWEELRDADEIDFAIVGSPLVVTHWGTVATLSALLLASTLGILL